MGTNPKCPLPITNKALILFFFMVSSHVFQQIALTNEANGIPKVFKRFVSLIQLRGITQYREITIL